MPRSAPAATPTVTAEYRQRIDRQVCGRLCRRHQPHLGPASDKTGQRRKTRHENPPTINAAAVHGLLHASPDSFSNSDECARSRASAIPSARMRQAHRAHQRGEHDHAQSGRGARAQRHQRAAVIGQHAIPQHVRKVIAGKRQHPARRPPSTARQVAWLEKYPAEPPAMDTPARCQRA